MSWVFRIGKNWKTFTNKYNKLVRISAIQLLLVKAEQCAGETYRFRTIPWLQIRTYLHKRKRGIHVYTAKLIWCLILREWIAVVTVMSFWGLMTFPDSQDRKSLGSLIYSTRQQLRSHNHRPLPNTTIINKETSSCIPCRYQFHTPHYYKTKP